MYRIKTIDTKDNTYQFAIGYNRTAKTDYEQREERRELKLYMIRQRLITIFFVIVMVMASILTNNILGNESGSFTLIGLVIGIPVLLYNKPVGLGGNWYE